MKFCINRFVWIGIFYSISLIFRPDFPLSDLYVVAEVRGVALDEEVDLEPVVGPAGELHEAGLLVEGEVLHVDGAARLRGRFFLKTHA